MEYLGHFKIRAERRMTKDADVEKLVFGMKLRFFALGIRCNNIKKKSKE